ncbi:MAG: HAMP domain-containing histidine kinase [Deltaproteobacteria bacterium]|nr:HAMP domain-containing histidine kinase [Deltaproteobacteria bacterium]
MTDRPDPIRSRESGIRGRARVVRARRRALDLTGLTALALAAAASSAALLATPGAPSLAFVLQCFAPGTLSLVVPSLQRLHRVAARLAVAAPSLLVLSVGLEVVRGGVALPLEIAACAVLLPLLATQLTGRLARIAAVGGAALGVLLVAAFGGMQGGALAHLGVALGFAATFALVVADVLVAVRERQDRQLYPVRGTMLRERGRTQAREELVANLSHDLRNPLAIALGFAEMAEDDGLSADDRASALSGIRRSLWDMQQLVEKVLDGSADQAGALVPSPEPLDLESVCGEALAATHILLRRRPIVLTGTLEPGVLVFADRHRLGRVIANLLGNACKYTVAGEIHVQTRSCGRHALIRVQDTGSGIAPDALPYIFDRYRRAHTGGPPGVGLGLAIARRLTERTGGTLEVESELGVGKTFTVTLPLCAARETGANESVAA